MQCGAKALGLVPSAARKEAPFTPGTQGLPCPFRSQVKGHLRVEMGPYRNPLQRPQPLHLSFILPPLFQLLSLVQQLYLDLLLYPPPQCLDQISPRVSFYINCVFCFSESGARCVVQASFKFLDASSPPASASHVVGPPEEGPCAWLIVL